jgi:hypothetical protein
MFPDEKSVLEPHKVYVCGIILPISTDREEYYAPKNRKTELPQMRKRICWTRNKELLQRELQEFRWVGSAWEGKKIFSRYLQELWKRFSNHGLRQARLLQHEMCQGVDEEESCFADKKMGEFLLSRHLEKGGNHRRWIRCCASSSTSSGQHKGESFGTSSGDGKASWEIFGTLGKGTPSEWDKDRQQDRKLRDCYSRQTKWLGCLSELPAHFSGTLDLCFQRIGQAGG